MRKDAFCNTKGRIPLCETWCFAGVHAAVRHRNHIFDMFKAWVCHVLLVHFYSVCRFFYPISVINSDILAMAFCRVSLHNAFVLTDVPDLFPIGPAYCNVTFVLLEINVGECSFHSSDSCSVSDFCYAVIYLIISILIINI